MRVSCIRIGLAVAVLAGLMAAPVAAQNCGPGPLVTTKDKGILLQILAITTNGFLFPTHTFAISSGTSGCSNDGIIKREYEQEFFVAANFDSLVSDMARGGGQYLAAMSELMGCGTERRAAFADAMRDEVAPFLAYWDDPWDAAAHLRTALATRPALAAGCTRLT